MAVPALPSAVAIDLAPSASSRALAARISDANPGGHPGGTYRLPREPDPGRGDRGRVRGWAASRSPWRVAVAVGAVLSLALALLASVRQRRRELALLKTLGLTRRQVMAAVAWQASVILAVAGLVGVPLGVAAGHWAWAAFATSLGAVPVTVVPVPALLAAFVVAAGGGKPAGRRPAARSPPGPRPRPSSGPNSAARAGTAAAPTARPRERGGPAGNGRARPRAAHRRSGARAQRDQEARVHGAGRP